MPDSSMPILHVFCRGFRQDCFVNTVLAEGGLVLFKAEAPQPACHVHDGAQTKLRGTSSSWRKTVSRSAEASSVVGLKGPPRRTEWPYSPISFPGLLA